MKRLLILIALLFPSIAFSAVAGYSYPNTQGICTEYLDNAETKLPNPNQLNDCELYFQIQSNPNYQGLISQNVNSNSVKGSFHVTTEYFENGEYQRLGIGYQPIDNNTDCGYAFIYTGANQPGNYYLSDAYLLYQYLEVYPTYAACRVSQGETASQYYIGEDGTVHSGNPNNEPEINAPIDTSILDPEEGCSLTSGDGISICLRNFGRWLFLPSNATITNFRNAATENNDSLAFFPLYVISTLSSYTSATGFNQTANNLEIPVPQGQISIPPITDNFPAGDTFIAAMERLVFIMLWGVYFFRLFIHKQEN